MESEDKKALGSPYRTYSSNVYDKWLNENDKERNRKTINSVIQQNTVFTHNWGSTWTIKPIAPEYMSLVVAYGSRIEAPNVPRRLKKHYKCLLWHFHTWLRWLMQTTLSLRIAQTLPLLSHCLVLNSGPWKACIWDLLGFLSCVGMFGFWVLSCSIVSWITCVIRCLDYCVCVKTVRFLYGYVLDSLYYAWTVFVFVFLIL